MLCVIGNNFADKGAKLGVEKHPSSEPLREFVKSLAISYKAICKFLVASCLKAFDLRPRVPKIVRAERQLDTGNTGPGHTLFLTEAMAGFSAVHAFTPPTGRWW